MPVHFKAFDYADGVQMYRRRLPHLRQDGCAYFVTFRLADSIPQHLVREWDMVRQNWLRLHPPPWDEATWMEYRQTFTRRMEEYLHAGYGSCLLRRSTLGGMVETSLCRYNENRYDLGDYVIMPNHVHAILKPYFECPLESSLGLCKGSSSRAIHNAMASDGQLWADESYDHIIRGGEEIKRVARYIRNNPAKGGRKTCGQPVGGDTAGWICDPPRCAVRNSRGLKAGGTS